MDPGLSVGKDGSNNTWKGLKKRVGGFSILEKGLGESKHRWRKGV